MRISDWSSDVCSSDLRHTCCLHLRCAQPPKQLGPAEGEERTVQRLQHLVEIWQRDHEGDRFALELGDLYQVLEGYRLELLAGIGDLGVRQRHKPPIARPGIIQYADDQCRFLIEALRVYLADNDAAVAPSRLDDALDMQIGRDHV